MRRGVLKLEIPVAPSLSYPATFFLIWWMKATWIRRYYAAGDFYGCLSLILFFINCYAAALIGLRSFVLMDRHAKRSNPRLYGKARTFVERGFEWWDLIMAIGTPLAVYLGIKSWSYVWTNYVCKSARDKICMKTWLGNWLSTVRNDVCFFGGVRNPYCDRSLALFPILLMLAVLYSVFAYLGLELSRSEPEPERVAANRTFRAATHEREEAGSGGARGDADPRTTRTDRGTSPGLDGPASEMPMVLQGKKFRVLWGAGDVFFVPVGKDGEGDGLNTNSNGSGRGFKLIWRNDTSTLQCVNLEEEARA